MPQKFGSDGQYYDTDYCSQSTLGVHARFWCLEDHVGCEHMIVVSNIAIDHASIRAMTHVDYDHIGMPKT
jgi:hypothetical protein